jgi:hypothetical protein
MSRDHKGAEPYTRVPDQTPRDALPIPTNCDIHTSGQDIPNPNLEDYH